MALKVSEVDENTNSTDSFQFELLGPVGEKLIAPTCVSVSATGEYVVTDSDSCFIVIYNSCGDYLSHFSTIPKSSFYFLLSIDKHKPQDVAWLSSKKIVYTQPWGSKVTIANWKGQVTTCIEGKPLYQPFGVCVDQMDQIYITDREKGRVLCYSVDGKLIKSFGGLASNGFSLTSPQYIVIKQSGEIVINDIEKDSVSLKILDKKGGNSRTITLGMNMAKSQTTGCLALDLDNNVIQVDSNNTCLKVIEDNSNEDREFSDVTLDISHVTELQGIAMNLNGNLVCIDNHDKTIKIIPWAKNHLHCNGHVKTDLDSNDNK